MTQRRALSRSVARRWRANSTQLCEALQGSAVTSPECAAAPKAFAFMSAPADRKANTFCAHRLERNNLGPKGGEALAEGLKGNSTLQSLS